MSSLFDLCNWINDSASSTALRESILMFPIIEGLHLLAIGVSAGTIALTDLRLMGVVMKKDPASKVLKAILPFSIAGFVVVFITGTLLFWAEAAKSYRNPWFRFKLIFLLLAGLNALVFHTGIYRRMNIWDSDDTPPAKARMAGAVSLVLWATVIWLGRQFAYSS
jgi:uncharacterized membrane protein SirB2